MQTLHLRFRDLRAISPGQSPSRWRTRSMRDASTWKGASPLPNLPRPTSAVGLPAKTRVNQRAQAPQKRGGLLLAGAFRAPRICGAWAPDARRVCQGQTACELLHDPAPHKAGDHGAVHRQARASATLRATSLGLSFPLRPQLCGARACGEKTADPVTIVGAFAGVSSGAHWPRLPSAGG